MKKDVKCCFSTKHLTQNCPTYFSCSISGCQAKHRYLLHNDTRSSHTFNSSQEHDTVGTSQVESKSMCSFTSLPILLAIAARILLKNLTGESVIVNVVLDQGSMKSFVSKKIVSGVELFNHTYDR